MRPVGRHRFRGRDTANPRSPSVVSVHERIRLPRERDSADRTLQVEATGTLHVVSPPPAVPARGRADLEGRPDRAFHAGGSGFPIGRVPFGTVRSRSPRSRPRRLFASWIGPGDDPVRADRRTRSRCVDERHANADRAKRQCTSRERDATDEADRGPSVRVEVAERAGTRTRDASAGTLHTTVVKGTDARARRQSCDRGRSTTGASHAATSIRASRPAWARKDDLS